MRDPHVESLRYRVEPIGNTSYSNPPPLKYENGLCTLTLTDGVMFIKPKDHYASVQQARQVIEPFLRAWELDADLRYGLGTIRFKYEDHTIVDRNPPPPDDRSDVIIVGEIVLDGIAVSGSVSIHITRADYPKPPLSFQITPDVDTMWLRYCGYLEGREPLLAMAYCCLTIVEASVGGRKSAAQQYHIDKLVLDTLGHLTSENRGDAKTARKFKKGQLEKPLSRAEQVWVEEAVKALIRRMGEYRPGQIIADLCMRDLPSVP